MILRREATTMRGLRSLKRYFRDAAHGVFRNFSLSLASIAEFVNLSPAYLSDSFKKDTGKNIKQVISDIRLDKASELLRTTPLTVAEIAQKIGYRDSNYFSKFFKKRYSFFLSGWQTISVSGFRNLAGFLLLIIQSKLII